MARQYIERFFEKNPCPELNKEEYRKLGVRQLVEVNHPKKGTHWHALFDKEGWEVFKKHKEFRNALTAGQRSAKMMYPDGSYLHVFGIGRSPRFEDRRQEEFDIAEEIIVPETTEIITEKMMLKLPAEEVKEIISESLQESPPSVCGTIATERTASKRGIKSKWIKFIAAGIISTVIMAGGFSYLTWHDFETGWKEAIRNAYYLLNNSE